MTEAVMTQIIETDISAGRTEIWPLCTDTFSYTYVIPASHSMSCPPCSKSFDKMKTLKSSFST